MTASPAAPEPTGDGNSIESPAEVTPLPTSGAGKPSSRRGSGSAGPLAPVTA